MAETLQLSRDTKVYVRDFDASGAATSNNIYWEIPVLDGFAFSQATETTEVTLLEATDTNNKSRRGRISFNTALAPVEWSLTTYVRPFKSAGGRTNTSGGAVDNVAGYHHAVEEPLWAYMVLGTGETFGANNGILNVPPSRRVGETWGSTSNGVWSNTASMEIDFERSNKVTLRPFELIFAMSSNSSTTYFDTVYRIQDAVVNGVTLDFDIEGIAQLQWSGFGTKIISQKEMPTSFVTANTINEAVNSTNSFIRNRLSTVNVATKMTNFGASGNTKYYNVILTGGSITIDNGITYLTPEELGKVNIPIGHVSGTRSMSGTMTAYLDDDRDTNGTGVLFANMVANTTSARNNFELLFSIGGATAPKVEFYIPRATLEIPTHSVEDLISVEVNFVAQPNTISSTDEAIIRYFGVTPA
jgi:hypothetical protein